MSERIHEGAIRDEIAKTSGDNKKLLRDFSTELFECIRQGLLTDGHVRLHQFGSLKLKWTKERKGKNPQTGEAIIIPAHPRITFTATKALKDMASASATESIAAFTSQNKIKEEKQLENIISPKKVTLNKQSKEPVTKINAEPYLLKNIRSDRSSEKKQTFPVSLVATILLLVLGVYFINTDPDIEEAHNTTEVKTIATVPGINNPVKSLTGSVPATGSNIAKTNDTQKTLEPISFTTLKDEVIVFFEQRPHKLTNGDSLWRLSRKNYINPFYWPHIYQANKYRIRNPNKLLMGKTITLPTLNGHPKNLSREDRRNIAEGYFLVYKNHKKHKKPFPYYALLGVAKFDAEVIEAHANEIAEEDWNNLQIASN
jgi:nucleoid DNA-binding protein